MLYSEDLLQLASENKKELFTFDGKVVERAIKDIYKNKGFKAEQLGNKAGKELIYENYRVLGTAVDRGMAEVDASIKVEVREELKEALHDNALLFSGFKAYHTMREAGLTLQDKKTGGIKSFEVFRKEAEKIFKKQGLNLRAEYQHAVMTAQMATKWQEIVEDKDRYDLQYRTAGDDRVRKEHSVLNGVTLPVDDKFWAEFYPPNGWGCRCQAVQVRKGKYPHSDSKQAISNGYEMTSKPSQKIFRTNAGQTKKVFPDKHPNFPKGCGECPVKGGQTKLYYEKGNDICEACKIIEECRNKYAIINLKQKVRDLYNRNKIIQNLIENNKITKEEGTHRHLDSIAKEKGLNIPPTIQTNNTVAKIGTLPDVLDKDIIKRFGEIKNKDFYITDKQMCHAIRSHKTLDTKAVSPEELNQVYNVLEDKTIKYYFQKDNENYLLVKKKEDKTYIAYVFDVNTEKKTTNGKIRGNFFVTSIKLEERDLMSRSELEEVY